jgi:hypothetical protein
MLKAAKRFVQKPQLYLEEALSEFLADDEIEKLFVETEQYSARVVDVGVWSPPVLPWIKREPNDWLPEKFGLQIGGQYVVLDGKDIVPLREKIREARTNGEAFVQFGDEKICIPATVEAERSLSTLLGEIKPKQDQSKPDPVKVGGTDEESKCRENGQRGFYVGIDGHADREPLSRPLVHYGHCQSRMSRRPQEL